jgi:hypothetical protein
MTKKSIVIIAVTLIAMIVALKSIRASMDESMERQLTVIEVIPTSSEVQLVKYDYANSEELAARLTEVPFREITAIWSFDDQNPELPSSHSWIISVENVSAFIDSLASEHLPPTLTAYDTPNRELMVVTVGEPITRPSYYSGVKELNWIVTQSWRKI